MKRLGGALVVLGMCLATLLLWGVATANASESSNANGELAFTVVVIDELVSKPVLLSDFRIDGVTDANFSQVIRTDANGALRISLPAGQYSIESVKPITVKGKELAWTKTVTVESGKMLSITLTDADAQQQNSRGRITEESQIYQDTKKCVVTVESDFGQGSGFVVDDQGLIITNSHVTNATRWAAVRFACGVRLTAQLVEEDKQSDVAVLRFNPQEFKDFGVLSLADISKGPVAMEGEKVVALGSPLSKTIIMTMGIVSKVDGDVMMSDVNINPGNSGGPVMNFDKQVIGLATFVVQSKAAGPGVSGIVSANRIVPVLERAKAKLSDPPPSADLLPVISPVPIPTEALNEARNKEMKSYQMQGIRSFNIYMTTPYIETSMEYATDRKLAKSRNKRIEKRRSEGMKDKSEVDASRFYEKVNPLVSVYIVPQRKKKRDIFGFIGTILTGVDMTTHTYEYRDDFCDMRLFRGDKLVEPICRQRSLNLMSFNYGFVQGEGSAYGGLYQYDPSAFEPGEVLVLKIKRETNVDKWEEVKLNKKTQAKIWDEFSTWRDAVEATGKNDTAQ